MIKRDLGVNSKKLLIKIFHCFIDRNLPSGEGGGVLLKRKIKGRVGIVYKESLRDFNAHKGQRRRVHSSGLA